jgi:hypothetical protein
MLLLVLVNLQQGAMLGGVAMVLNIVLPQFSVITWAAIMAGVTIVLLLSGRYGLLEKLSTAMVAGFTLSTLICVSLLFKTPYQFSANELWEGLRFHLPQGGAAIAVAVFGITGIGATELIYYPYWCIEKGYARSVGAYQNTSAWYERAQGWIRTMNWDALLSMVIYTILTIAFYVLGAAVLHSQNLLPEGMEMIRVLSQMYTEVLGIGAFYIFLAGAFFTLFSTLFVSIAANAMLFTDCFRLLGVARLHNYADRLRWIRRLITVLPIFQFVLFLSFQLPLWMVIIGGTAQTLMLPAIAFGTLYLRYFSLDKKLLPSRGLDLLLWISCLAIAVVAAYGLISKW